MSKQENEQRQNLESKLEDKEQKNIEDIPGELEKIPPEIKGIVEASLSMQRFSGSLTSPIQQKINEQHISQILDITEKDSERAFTDAELSRRYTLATIVIILLFFIFLTIFLVNKDVVVYQEILKIIIIFGGGFGSGIGYTKVLDRKNK